MILGISIDENFVYVSSDSDEKITQLPFAIGKNLANKSWFIGDEARVENVDNADIVIDKLFYLLENDGNARIGDVTYEAKDLARIFFNNLMLKYDNVECATVVVRKSNVKILSKLKVALSQNVENKNKYKVTTYSEAFIAYIRSREKEYYSNPIALFDFTAKALTYYELIRYKGIDDVEYWKVDTVEHLALPLDLLSGETGKKVCDNLLYDFAKKCLKEEVYNNIILAGVGFEDTSSYREFMTYVCGLTDVNTDTSFFSKSALILSRDILNNNVDKSIIYMTDARTTVSIKLNAIVNQTKTKIELVTPGEEWFNIYKKEFQIIIEDESEVRFECLKVIEGVISEFVISVPDSEKLRKDKSNLFSVSLTFLQQNLLQVSLTDVGFGEFYEPVFKRISQDFNL